MSHNGFSPELPKVPELGSPYYFSPIDVDERIGRGLVKAVFLKYGMLDAGTYANTAELRAQTSHYLPEVQSLGTSLAHVQRIGKTYAWNVLAKNGDDDLLVIRPSDRAPDQPGRWLAAPFRDWRGPYYWHGLDTVGFVDRAVPLDAPETQPSLLSLCAGKTPSVFVSFLGKSKPEVLSDEPGALHRDTLNFLVRVISKNWRGSASARFGSDIPEEAAADPGASELVGRLIWLFRGSQGLYGTVPGGGYAGARRPPANPSPFVDFATTIIGAHRTAASFGNDMRLMDELEISVVLGTERPNELQDLHQVEVFNQIERQPLDDLDAVQIGPGYIITVRKTP